MIFIKKFKNFISEKITQSESDTDTIEVEEETKIPLKTATAEDVVEKFITLLRKKGDDVKKYIEKK